MALATGTRIGPHEVLGQIGAGGMGEVYRARDTRLNRDVALKVLPESVALDPDRLARFKREAHILASMGHPNIAAIFGFEDAMGLHALVLELVEGPTLADLIASGPLPYDDALGVAKQIAEALEAAHEQGIVHRDLKPANVKRRPDGVVKVLDFGLAKSTEPVAAGTGLPDTPTLTTPAVTGIGTILGTAAYMSPEQARGKPVDRRADVWAFGCVLYEMLTGARVFQAESVTDTIAAVIRADPDWSRLPGAVSPAIRSLLVRCLEKDPRRRLRDIGEARIALENALAGTDDRAAAATVPVSSRRVMIVAAAVALVSVSAGAGGVWLAMRRPEPPPVRLSIVPPPDAQISAGSIAISPDGRSIVYVSGNGTQLSVRALDDLTPRHLTNLGTPRYPFISPDGQRVAFFDGLNALKVVPITGGPAVTLCTLRGAAGRGGSWTADGAIVFATDDPATGLWRVSDQGGTPQQLTTPQRENGDQQWPEVLPGGRAALVTLVGRGPSGPQIAVVDLGTGAQKILLPGLGAHYVPTGHLIYAAGGELRAIRFDVERLETSGTSVPLPDRAAGGTSTMAPSSPLAAAVAAAGTLAYVHGPVDSSQRRLVWVDRQGHEELVPAPPKGYVIPRVSPDGSKIAVDSRDADAADVWIWDLRRQTMTRTTFGVSIYPVWTPDSARVAHTTFDAARAGHLFLRIPDGRSESLRLTEGTASRYGSSFSPDGTRLFFREEAGDTGLDIGVVTLGTQRSVQTLLKTAANELNPEISPDGRWLAYESNQSGQTEVYVRPFPNVDAGLWQVSAEGGRHPAWTRNGRELLFIAPDGSLMGVAVDLDPRFSAGVPAKIVAAAPYYSSGPYRSYDVSADGKRFLMIKADAASQSASASIAVVQNWFVDLKRLLP